MKLLQREYLNNRLQRHFDELRLPQTRSKLELPVLLEALKAKGAIQTTEAPEEDNIFCWPFELKNDGHDPIFLTHCNLSFFHMYRGKKWEKHTLCFTMGLFSTYACKKEKPAELVEEIIRIDRELIPQWIEEFRNLHPLEMTELAVRQFYDQCTDIRGKTIIMDVSAARVYGVTVTEVRRAISCDRKAFEEEQAFHLTKEEYEMWQRKDLCSPKSKKREYLPYALTFSGFCMLSMRLHSDFASKINVGMLQTMTARKPLTELLKQLRESDDNKR